MQGLMSSYPLTLTHVFQRAEWIFPEKGIATVTGGKFYRAKSAGAVQDAYASLGAKLGRKPGSTEVTDLFLMAAAGLLVLAGALSALVAPRLP